MMKHYLDLEGLSASFHETHGLIEITQAQAEAMVKADERLILSLYNVDEPPFYSVRFKKLA